MKWLDKFYRDETFLNHLESRERRNIYLKKLIKNRTICLFGLVMALVALLASWFSNTAIVVFFGVLLVNMDLDQKVKWVKWVDRQDGRN